MIDQKLLVIHSDGSTRPSNPGYSGYGVFGYTLVPSKRPNKSKHPVKNKLYFTSNGFSETADTEPYETIDIVEYIGSINSPTSTNNIAELLGFCKAMEIAISLKVTKLTVLTDSSYVVNNFNENLTRWKETGWTRVDGKPIANIKEWELAEQLSNALKEVNCEIDIRWIKGHADEYGNETADLYANIGSTYAKNQFDSNTTSFNEVAYFNCSSYKDYKETLLDKDIVYYFRDLFFSSANIKDADYCFLSTSDDVNEQGRRDTSSIFLTNIGYVPELINKVKSLYRDIPRIHTANCCIKLNKLEDKELARLARLVGIEKLLRPVKHNGITSFHLIKDPSPFVTEFNQEFPYITEVGKIFKNSLDIMLVPNNPLIKEVDITDIFVKEGKINFTNLEKDIDLTERVSTTTSDSSYFKDLVFINKLIATVGKDFPNYLALKHIEDSITKVSAIVEIRQDSSHVTLYIAIHTSDRVLCTVNITNKFLTKRS